ncbi:MAG: hypothetical protein LBI68_07875, partial [Azoarcus sp.]|nr:hypothetical protein [Azoarcus sp.]
MLKLDAMHVKTGNITIASGGKNTGGNQGATGTAGVGAIPGSGGDGGAEGADGSASFFAHALAAPSISLTRNNGALIVEVDKLDASAQNTELRTSGTLDTEVHFGSIDLHGGRTLDVSGAAITSYRFDTLNVTASAKSARIAGDFSFEKRSLNFFPTPTIDEGITMLDIGGTVNLASANISAP